METYEIWERDDAATLNGLTGERQRERGGICSANADSDVNNKQPSMPNRL